MPITLVQGRAGAANGYTLAYSSPVTAGSLLVVGVSYYLSAGATDAPSCSDTQGNTYTPTPNIIYAPDNNMRIRFFYALNAAAGSTTITIANAIVEILVLLGEFSGVATTSALDVGSSGVTNPPSTTTPAANATGTLAQADEVIVALMAWYGSTTTLADDTADGFSHVAANPNGASLPATGMQYKVTSSTASVVANWTLGTSYEYIADRLTFKAAAGGGGTNATATPAAIAVAITLPDAQPLRAVTPVLVAPTVLRPTPVMPVPTYPY